MSSSALRLILGIEKPELDRQTEKLLSENEVGGIILFDRNCTNLKQLELLVERIRSTCLTEPLVAIDFEGGRIRRGSGLFGYLGPAGEYKLAGPEKLFYDCFKIGQQFKDVGINVNLAPVADLSYDPVNPALAERTYSSDSLETSDYCRTFIRAFSEAGISSCLKHFPGLGSAVNDPHEKYSISCISVDRLIKYDWIPFKAGIDADADMIMTTHILMSAIDDKPATFSKKTIKLMRELGFNRIIITDDMTMGAVRGDDLPEKVLSALLAGHDLALICHECDRHQEVIDFLENNMDRLEAGAHNQSLERITDAKNKVIKAHN